MVKLCINTTFAIVQSLSLNYKFIFERCSEQKYQTLADYKCHDLFNIIPKMTCSLWLTEDKYRTE